MARKASYDLPEVRQKALDLFWAKGFRGTSLKDLENALDMRPGSIYAAFGSKENLYQDTLALYAETIRQDFEQTMAAAPSALSGVAAYVRGLGAAAGAGYIMAPKWGATGMAVASLIGELRKVGSK